MDALIVGDETRLEQAKIPQPQQIAHDVISQPPRICAVLDFAQPVMQAPSGQYSAIVCFNASYFIP